ncbi:hypothetical protein AAG589_13795 [Isoptericola sp. F-RaC21]|uniref:hypothetical protein n=1 Tax=Isoptericola sp. F-RaC21 TaxID=3141452 RepID=UPI00315C483F
MTRTRTAGVALLALAVAGGLAACSTNDAAERPSLEELQASASASPSPSLSAEEQEKQQVIEEAEDFLAEMRQAEVDSMQSGFTGWPRLVNEYWGSDLAQAVVPMFQKMSAKKRFTTGEPELVSSEVTDYVAEDAGYEQVEFTTCLDRSSLKLHEKDGKVLPNPDDLDDRYVNVYRLEHQGEGKSWRVTESDPQEESC